MQITILLRDHKTISWNKLYQQRHWTYRAKLANDIHELVHKEMESMGLRGKKLKKIALTIESHSRRVIDCTNVGGKLYEDGIKTFGLIEDDTPEFVDSFTAKSFKSDKDYTVIKIKELKR